MTFLEIITETRRIVKANSTSYPTDDIVVSANNALERVNAKIRKAQGRWQDDDSNYTDFPSATTDINSGQGDYSLDSSMYRIEKVEFLDANGSWLTLIPFDISDARCQSYSNLVETTGTPQIYDKTGNSIILAPKPDVNRDAALKVTYERGPSYFTDSDTTKTPGFNPLFHKLIPLWAAYDYAFINQLPIANNLFTALPDGRETGRIADMEKELEGYYALRDEDEHIKLSVRRYTRFV